LSSKADEYANKKGCEIAVGTGAVKGG